MLKHKKLFSFSILATLLLIIPSIVFAQEGGVAGLAETLRKQITAIADILVVVSYVAGVGFALAGIVQFKAHKDNPAQVPLSKPIVYLVVGACLLFLPNILETAGSTVFGEGKEEAIKKTFTTN